MKKYLAVSIFLTFFLCLDSHIKTIFTVNNLFLQRGFLY